MIRVLHTESSEGWGGQEIRIVEECIWFNANVPSITCSILAAEGGQFLSKRGGVPVEINLGPISRKNLTGLGFVFRYLKKHRPDVVITHSSTDSWLIAVATIGLGNSPKIVRVRHVSAAISPSWLTRWLYKRAAYIVTTSDAIRTHICQTLEISSDRVASIPTGLDLQKRFLPPTDSRKLEAREFLKLGPHRPIITMISTLRSWKGHIFALKALEIVKHATLLIVGDGPQEEALRQMVIDLDLQDRVLFLGYRPDPLPILFSTDIFIQPSYANEGWSQSLMQAMAVGLPVIASDIGGLNEMINDGVDGVLVPPKNYEKLAGSLVKVLSDGPLSRSLGLEARRSAERFFTIEVMGKKMHMLIEECLS